MDDVQVWGGSKADFLEETTDDEDFDGYFMDAIHDTMKGLPDGEYEIVIRQKGSV